MMTGQTAREALRGAQLELKNSNLWRSPYVWSAFMMVGSYDTSGIKES
jgi:CHAT domain-containing protein